LQIDTDLSCYSLTNTSIILVNDWVYTTS
jgi:hypothetical protein